MKLNDEQRKLVEENHNLIYWYIDRRKLELNEYYDLLAIELCNAVVHYDPSKGSFANYFKLRADGAVNKEYRKSKAKKRIPLETEYIDNVYAEESTEDMLDELVCKDWLDKTDCEIVRLKLTGYSQMDIADILDVSQSYVSKTLKRLRKDFDNAVNG